MPKHYKDFSNPATDSVQMDVSAIANSHGVDADELESFIREYQHFAEKELVRNRIKKKRYTDIENALAATQEGLETAGIKYKDVRFIGLIILVQHKQDMLPASDPLSIRIEGLLIKTQKMLQASDLYYLEDGDDDILSILEQVQKKRDGMRAGKSGPKQGYNAILVRQLATLHHNPTVNTWPDGNGYGSFFELCMDVFDSQDALLTDSAIIHLIERYIK